MPCSDLQLQLADLTVQFSKMREKTPEERAARARQTFFAILQNPGNSVV
jgi:hypothetical protein